ncbi:AAA family ATPase [Variovorax sp. J31P207]|uniref:AAA family ATPase n=1 Tax=Variovorax sp. J31P207 TaxID=3053510 RepID=UPI002574EBD2|nr:AAA family ATPase [Variovorax sp. J31P207]MDM0065227.1 AAA family ATPase [Variovorax sp. J31P207]
MQKSAIIDPSDLNPYGENILIGPLGSILSPARTLELMTVIPQLPALIESIPRHLRLHWVMFIRNLYLPPGQATPLAATVDVMIREGYSHRNPADARTWAQLSGYSTLKGLKAAPASAAVLGGDSGTGKTETFKQIFGLYPQVIKHQSYPGIIGHHLQVVHLSVNVPAGGRSPDLARALGTQWDLATQGNRFSRFVDLKKPNGQQMLDEWSLVARAESLGILHLDEIQNLFHIPTLEERRRKKAPEQPGPMLRISDDNALKWLLTFINSGIPTVTSGTYDGIGALTKRLSTMERVSTMGYYSLERFNSIDPKSYFRRIFFKQLLKLQFVKDRIEDSDELARVVIDRTAGIQRLIIALWIAAHRVAFDRAAASRCKVDNLLLQDFKTAADTYLKLLQPCVKALLSNTPDARSRYEDLVPRDDDFWALFWNKVGTI